VSNRSNYYAMTSPCDKCPFRTDVEPYLTPDRVREIGDSLVRSEFPCHKTTVEGDGEDEDELQQVVDGPSARHCAGALIVLEKMEQPSQMMRICERLGMYDRRKLDMDAPVYDSIEEMMQAQKRRRRTGRATAFELGRKRGDEDARCGTKR
jgi:hypothetical protein